MVTHPPPVVERARRGGRDRGGRGRGARGRGGGRGRGGRARGGGRAPKPVPNLPNDVNAPTQRLSYYRCLVKFMSYTKKEQFADDRLFTK